MWITKAFAKKLKGLFGITKNKPAKKAQVTGGLGEDDAIGGEKISLASIIAGSLVSVVLPVAPESKESDSGGSLDEMSSHDGGKSHTGRKYEDAREIGAGSVANVTKITNQEIIERLKNGEGAASIRARIHHRRPTTAVQGACGLMAGEVSADVSSSPTLSVPGTDSRSETLSPVSSWAGSVSAEMTDAEFYGDEDSDEDDHPEDEPTQGFRPRAFVGGPEYAVSVQVARYTFIEQCERQFGGENMRVGFFGGENCL